MARIIKTPNIIDPLSKSDYDINDNSVVDNTEKLNEQESSYYLSRGNHVGDLSLNALDDGGAIENDILTWNGTQWSPTTLDFVYLKAEDLNVDEDNTVEIAREIKGIDATGNNKYYGTNNIGAPGFYNLPNPGLVILNELKTSNFTTADNKRYLVDTTSGVITATLHDNPVEESIIEFIDIKGSNPDTPIGFGNNKLIINAPSGTTIQGYNTLELQTENDNISLIYNSTNNRWSILSTSLSFQEETNLEPSKDLTTVLKSGTFTVDINSINIVDTQSTVSTANLPSNPELGSICIFVDRNNTFNLRNLTINAAAGNTIVNNTSSSLVLNKAGAYVQLVFEGSKWHTYSSVPIEVDEALRIKGVTTAGNSRYYGTNSSGTVGFHNLPTSTGGSGGSGEINTGANLGSGQGIYIGKIGPELQFKSLVEGSGITLSSTANTISIAANPITQVNNALNLGNNLPAYYLDRSNHTGTQAANTIIGLSLVATSNSYNDLTNLPTIPTNTSDLINDSNFVVNTRARIQRITLNADKLLTATDAEFLTVSPTAAGYKITLPETPTLGLEYTIRTLSSSNPFILEEFNNTQIVELNTTNSQCHLIYDGTEWIVTILRA